MKNEIFCITLIILLILCVPIPILNYHIEGMELSITQSSDSAIFVKYGDFQIEDIDIFVEKVAGYSNYVVTYGKW